MSLKNTACKKQDNIKAENHVTFFFFLLIFTCFGTERVRKLFISSFKLKEFSRGKVQIPCLCKQQTNITVFYIMRCSFLHNLEQRLSVFDRGCVEKYSVETSPRYRLASKSDQVSVFSSMKIN